MDDRRDLFAGRGHTPAVLVEVKEFATALQGTFLDAAPLFQTLDRTEIAAYWFPYDGHWNQAGSDRFVEWLQAQPAWQALVEGPKVE